MAEMMWQTERNEMCRERHELSVERLNQIAVEESVAEPFSRYFQEMAVFLLEAESVMGETGTARDEGKKYAVIFGRFDGKV